MKFEKTQVFNIDGALRGMRNPLNSWHYADTASGVSDIRHIDEILDDVYPDGTIDFDYWVSNIMLHTDGNFAKYTIIGPNDLKLAQKLIKAGPEHRKFLRQIFVSVDITAPLYFYKEFDTYKISTVANSTSTMHKLTSNPITLDCFEMGDFEEIVYHINDASDGEVNDTTSEIAELFVEKLELLRQKYNETKDKRYWKELVRWLPNGWLQTRTWTANYEVLRAMYFQRKNHKLTEWHSFCEWVESLPYAKELIIYEG